MPPSPFSQTAALHALRRATAERHQAIESVIRLDGEWDMSHYVRVLWGFERFLHAWEPALTGALPARLHAWFAGRSRRVFLHADLEVLGKPREGVAAFSMAMPGMPVIPAIRDTAAAIGSLYVIEGSALGGQLIARRLLERHGRTAAQGGAYFTGWGSRTGAMWQQFRELLAQELGDDAGAIESACRGACDTFDALTRTFEAMLNERVAN